MARKAGPGIDEAVLSKGELRSLTALRKKYGEQLADELFAKWLRQQATDSSEPEDKNANLVTEALEPLIKKNKLKIPRGGYLVRRGRGRVIVERARGE